MKKPNSSIQRNIESSPLTTIQERWPSEVCKTKSTAAAGRVQQPAVNASAAASPSHQ